MAGCRVIGIMSYTLRGVTGNRTEVAGETHCCAILSRLRMEGCYEM